MSGERNYVELGDAIDERQAERNLWISIGRACDAQPESRVMTRRNQPEAAIQRAVFAHFRARSAPGVFAFHPANGGYRNPIEAKILQGLGVTAGVPDVIAIYQGRCYALEIKAKGGRATAKQLEAIAAMEAAGANCCVAEGLDHALACLEAWGLLRGHAP